MKWFIASDIHGSAYYCRLMLDAYKKENADRMILLGDLLYHGPRNDLPEGYAPKEVIAMLNDLKDEILCVRGNCEAEVDQMVLQFPVLADYALLAEGTKSIFITHGQSGQSAAHEEGGYPPARSHPCARDQRRKRGNLLKPRLRLHPQGKLLARLHDSGKRQVYLERLRRQRENGISDLKKEPRSAKAGRGFVCILIGVKSVSDCICQYQQKTCRCQNGDLDFTAPLCPLAVGHTC